MWIGAGDSLKARRLIGLAHAFPDKLVVFTQLRETRALLERSLREAGEEVALFHGGLTRVQKEEAIAAFRDRHVRAGGRRGGYDPGQIQAPL